MSQVYLRHMRLRKITFISRVYLLDISLISFGYVGYILIDNIDFFSFDLESCWYWIYMLSLELSVCLVVLMLRGTGIIIRIAA